MTFAVNTTQKRIRTIGWFLLVFAFLGVALFLIWFPFERSCISLLAAGEPPMMLPEECALSEAAPTGQILEKLEAERNRRGLRHQSWIACASPASAQLWLKKIDADPRWLPSYEPGRYEWRRTVIVLGSGPSATGKNSPSPSSTAGARVTAEVCLMPTWRYFQLIRGQCDAKFAVWK
ncbi:MAG TPA: hypothetical protein VGI46_22590 [Candidatus Acidoferrum sp.]|jgi:hypothetical protein